jgi:hypothetical protein
VIISSHATLSLTTLAGIVCLADATRSTIRSAVNTTAARITAARRPKGRHQRPADVRPADRLLAPAAVVITCRACDLDSECPAADAVLIRQRGGAHVSTCCSGCREPLLSGRLTDGQVLRLRSLGMPDSRDLVAEFRRELAAL